jgi:sucrose-6-phosphate hydrolase SacC (GH32 family)
MAYSKTTTIPMPPRALFIAVYFALTWSVCAQQPLQGTPAVAAEQTTAYQKLIDADADDPLRYTERWRPQFHFTPILGFMNDPNGLVFFENQWHLFYQHSQLEKMGLTGVYWGHAISSDLVRWHHLPPAIAPDAKGMIYTISQSKDDRQVKSS